MRHVLLLLCLTFSAIGYSQTQTYSADLESSDPDHLYIDKGDQTGLDFSADMTLEAWVRLESTSSSQTIISDHRTTGGNRHSKYRFRIEDSSGTLQLSVSADGDVTTECSISYSFSTATWYWLVATYDASAGQTELFVNGQSIGTCSSQATSLYVTSYDWPIKIGMVQVTNNPLDGLIKSVRIFDDIRTSDELRSDAYSGGVSDANLQAEWMLNNALTDGSGNGNTLTNSGATFVTTLPPWMSYTHIAGQHNISITHLMGIAKTSSY